MNPLEILGYATGVWLLLAVGSYAAIRYWMHQRQSTDPVGWRFNHHGAMWTGHLSFYEREGGGAVVFRSFKPFPVVWVVKYANMKKNEDLERRYWGTPWGAYRYGYRLMRAETHRREAGGGGHGARV